MSSLTSVDKRYFEDLFNLGSGSVISKEAYTNPTFAEFFRECAGIDIYHDKYEFNGNSKAKRLRAFWEIELDQIVGKVLVALLEVWSYENPTQDQQRYKKAVEIVNRLQGKQPSPEPDEKTFLSQQFEQLNLSKIGLDESLLPVIQNRLQEVQKYMQANAPLSVIFLSGSILEGVLLAVASQNPKAFNQAKSAPKTKEGKVKQFPEWSLAQFIDTAYECGFLKLDVKKFSHELRDFRNYILPFQQACSGFQPTKHTAEMCLQVLKAAIADLSGERK